MRRIKQTKRRLEDEEVSSKVRRALDAELFDLRVDLNYVVVRLSNAYLLARLKSISCPELPQTGEVHLTLSSRRAEYGRCCRARASRS
jgi:hypothetical protein